MPPEEPEEPERIELAITNTTSMFKAETAYLEIKDGETTLVMALSGTGYKELVKGTYEPASWNSAFRLRKENPTYRLRQCPTLTIRST